MGLRLSGKTVYKLVTTIIITLLMLVITLFKFPDSFVKSSNIMTIIAAGVYAWIIGSAPSRVNGKVNLYRVYISLTIPFYYGGQLLILLGYADRLRTQRYSLIDGRINTELSVVAMQFILIALLCLHIGYLLNEPNRGSIAKRSIALNERIINGIDIVSTAKEPVQRQGIEIRVFVTGITGQLGHDVVIEAVMHGHEVIGSGGRKGEDMKVFVTGVGGQLGHDVINKLERRGHESIGSDIAQYSGVQDGSAVVNVPYVQLDITDREAVGRIIEEIHPDVIIHCAAWTAVDAAEDEENRVKVDAINHLGTQYIAEAAKAVDAKMVYISTDYVFDGQGERPWEPDDKCYAPLNVYGKSKLDGELAVSSTLSKYFIVRIAWVFGLNGKNFIKTMINVGKTHDTVRVVNDQIGTPTYTRDLARLLVDMIETEKYGYYHATNEGGYISWYDFCCEFYKQYGLGTKVIPVTTAEYGLSKAARPFNSRLEKKKLVEAGFKALPTWQDAVKRYLAEAEL